MAVKNFIVAIELGSTKIRGIAGQKKPDGTIQVLAVVSEDATQSIRKGVIYNSDKTVQCITNIMQRLRASLHSGIKQVFVGVGGQSIHSVNNIIERDIENGEIVSQALVDSMIDINSSTEYPDKKILDVEIQEYHTDSIAQMAPVGIQCSHLEANFLNILQNQRHTKRIESTFETAGVKIAELYFAPFVLADAVLTPLEKRGGCVLVDLGADTTTVLVYYKNIVRNIAVIPLGANNITKDICSLQIEDQCAEEMKLRYASAYTPEESIDPTLKYDIDSDRKGVDSLRFIELVEARVMEIVANVWNQVPAEYVDKMVGGIILTGGGSNLKNIEVAFRKITMIEKVRIAKFVNYTLSGPCMDSIAKDGTMNTIIGLLAKGDQNCWLPEEPKQKGPDIFGHDPLTGKPVGENAQEVVAQNTGASSQDNGNTGSNSAEGNTEESKNRREEEEQNQHEDEEQNVKEKKGTGIGSRIIKFLGEIMKPDE